MSGVEQAELLSLWLLVALLVCLFLWRKSVLLAQLFLISASARIVVGVLQTGFALFFTNQDSVVYSKQGSLIAAGNSSYVLSDLSPNQIGIIATNASVSTFAGPIPTMVMVAILASLISALAVVLTVAPFLAEGDGAPPSSYHRRLLFYGAALSPSFVFWGSLDGKEPFLMLGVAMFVYSFYVGWPTKVIFGPGGILICVAFRPYIGALVLCVGVLFALARPLRRRAPRATLVLLFLAALWIGIRYGANIVGVELSEQARYSKLAGGNSAIGGGWLTKVGEFFFAPLPWQTPRSIQGLLSYIESMIIGGLIIRYLFQLVSRRRELTGDGPLIAVLLYFTGATIYAAASANSGTLSRERSPFLLVLLPLLIFSIGRLHLRSPESGKRIPVGERSSTPELPSTPGITKT